MLQEARSPTCPGLDYPAKHRQLGGHAHPDEKGEARDAQIQNAGMLD
jgi:hypothetical protein